jgi:hypothetical protein
LREAKTLHASLMKKIAKAAVARKAQLAQLDSRLSAIADLDPDDSRMPVSRSARPPSSLQSLSGAFDQLADAVDGVEGAPTPDAETGFTLRANLLDQSLLAWTKLQKQIVAIR